MAKGRGCASGGADNLGSFRKSAPLHRCQQTAAISTAGARDADHPKAPEELKRDAAIVRRWLGASDTATGVTNAVAGRLTVVWHEKFARGLSTRPTPGKPRLSAPTSWQTTSLTSAIISLVSSTRRTRMPSSDHLRKKLEATQAERQRLVAMSLDKKASPEKRAFYRNMVRSARAEEGLRQRALEYQIAQESQSLGPTSSTPPSRQNM